MVDAGRVFLVKTSEKNKVHNGIVLRQGFSKGVRIIRHNSRLVPALVVDGGLFLSSSERYLILFKQKSARFTCLRR